MAEIKGWHVLGAFILAFSVIIAVNIALAYNAIRTFPGIEVKNSYVASQTFDADRAAQTALGWDVSAWVEGEHLYLKIEDGTGPVHPIISSATFGRATSVAWDQVPEFAFDGAVFSAPIDAGPGNWNLRIKMRAADGTLFQQRIVVDQR